MSNHFDNQPSLRDTGYEDAIDAEALPSRWRQRLQLLQRNAKMSDGKNKGPGDGIPAATGTVEAFATQVLSLVASKTPY